MTLREDLTHRSTEFNAKAWAKKIVTSEALQHELYDCLFNEPPAIGSRASWVLSHCHDLDPGIIASKEDQLIGLLKQKGLHHGITRNILRIYQEQPVPEEHSAFMLDTCYAFLKNPSEPIAIRAFSMTVIFNISKTYPELLNELAVVLQSIAQHEEAPALISRSKNTLKAIQKLKAKAGA
jgi:hypothetical protein